MDSEGWRTLRTVVAKGTISNAFPVEVQCVVSSDFIGVCSDILNLFHVSEQLSLGKPVRLEFWKADLSC